MNASLILCSTYSSYGTLAHLQLNHNSTQTSNYHIILYDNNMVSLEKGGIEKHLFFFFLIYLDVEATEASPLVYFAPLIGIIALIAESFWNVFKACASAMCIFKTSSVKSSCDLSRSRVLSLYPFVAL